jgi:hypothetical protein
MTALLQVAGRTAEAKNQEFLKALLGALKILFGVHRAEDVILRDPAIERGDKTPEAVFANEPVHILIVYRGPFHKDNGTNSG